jgi:hypothetical protein
MTICFWSHHDYMRCTDYLTISSLILIVVTFNVLVALQANHKGNTGVKDTCSVLHAKSLLPLVTL